MNTSEHNSPLINLGTDVPLCVGLSGSLSRTDLTVESFFTLVRRNPFSILKMPLWLWRGTAYFKERIAERIAFSSEMLSFHEEFLQYLNREHKSGRSLILATACNWRIANTIANHLGIFSQILASDDRTNLTGREKRMRLVREFGKGGFDYAGNGKYALEIWPFCRKAILVNPRGQLELAARKCAQVSQVFRGKRATTRSYLRAIRGHQWLKNLLIFVPIFAAHEWSNLRSLIATVGAFVAFGLVASATYILNDMLDLSADRSHPGKRDRPFACGEISLVYGIRISIAMLLAGIGVGVTLSLQLLACVLIYIVLTLSYSFALKQKPLVDVLALSMLYTVRIIAGGIVANVLLSFWLLAFSTFIFLSLALVKRCSELQVMELLEKSVSVGRGYRVADISVLYQMGISSGYIAVLVVAFYINSPDVSIHYNRPETLWLLCPLLLYWVSRIWLVTKRGKMHEDPVTFAMRDRVSLCVVVLIGLVFLLALPR